MFMENEEEAKKFKWLDKFLLFWGAPLSIVLAIVYFKIGDYYHHSYPFLYWDFHTNHVFGIVSEKWTSTIILYWSVMLFLVGVYYHFKHKIKCSYYFFMSVVWLLFYLLISFLRYISNIRFT